jgi:hypothetical protein
MVTPMPLDAQGEMSPVMDADPGCAAETEPHVAFPAMARLHVPELGQGLAAGAQGRNSPMAPSSRAMNSADMSSMAP